jgi:hypothetical protein
MLVWEGGKGPDEQAPFDIDWSARLLAGETILTSSWSITDGDEALVLVSNDFIGNRTQVMLSGGTPCAVYTLQNEISTASCPSLTEKVQLPMRNR